jgi:hypothetical protein
LPAHFIWVAPPLGFHPVDLIPRANEFALESPLRFEFDAPSARLALLALKNLFSPRPEPRKFVNLMIFKEQ